MPLFFAVAPPINGIMNSNDDPLSGPRGPISSDMAGGPWGDEPAEGAPAGSGGDDGTRSGDGRKPSPWLPGRGTTGQGGRSAGSSRLDEVLKRGPFGPKLPGMPNDQRVWTWAGVILLLLWAGLTGFHRLDPEEDGVITRLGSYSRTVGPGISATLPFPFERLQRVPARRIQTEDIPDGTTRNLVLTGDANIINLAYSVRWKVNRPEQFVFQVDSPRDTIRAAAESAMRATVANFTLAQAIGSGRTDIELQVQQRLQAILDFYRVGVQIDGVSIRDSAPPSEVEEAFNNVNVAQQDAESFLNEARAYAAQVTSQAEGAAAEFDRIYEQYRQSPEVTRRRLYYETMEAVLTRSDKTIIGSGNVVPYLPLSAMERRAPAPQGQPAAASSEGNRP